MPSTALQSRIAAFESIANPSFGSNRPLISKQKAAPASPSPSPPNLGRKTSLIDLKDWVVEDGPSPLRTNGFQYDDRTPTQQAFESKKQLVTPLIHLESPPKTKLKAPPLPPRKPSNLSLKSLASSASRSTNSTSVSPKSDTLQVDHTYPPVKIDSNFRSKNTAGHAPASSISSFHSVSLSSDTDPSTPGSVSSTFISTFPIDYEQEQNNGKEADSVSLTESYEEVPTPLVTSPATDRAISLDWEKAFTKRKSPPPKLPQRPPSTSSPSATSPRPAVKSPSSSTPGSPGVRASVSSISSSSTTDVSTSGRRPPPLPPSRSSNRSSIQSTATTRSIGSNFSHSSQGHNTWTYNNINLKTKRPTPVPAAARARYELVFNANVVQSRKAEKQKSKDKPPLLSVSEARGTRRAAGWRGLSVDLITGGHDIPPAASSEDEEEVSTVVEGNEKLEGQLIKNIWRRSKLDRSRLSEIWNECDPGGTGSLTRDAFVKGMWRIDEELRRLQTHALKSGSNLSSGSLRDKASFKPPVSRQKPILR